MIKGIIRDDLELSSVLFFLASILTVGFLKYREGMLVGMLFQLTGIILISYQILFNREELKAINKKRKDICIALGCLLIVFGMSIQITMFASYSAH